MRKFRIGITIESDSTATVQKVANLIQDTVNKVEHKDIINLLEKVAKNPSIVKTALNFI